MATRSTAVAVPAAARPGTIRRVTHACAVFSLWLMLGIGLGATALVALPGLFGYSALTVVSGSMEPTLETGSVVIDEVISPLDAHPGDIVTFADPTRPRELTHRLTRMRVQGDTAYMVTLGDANDVPERWTVPLDGEIGRVAYHVPKLGYVRAALTKQQARLVLLGVVILFGGLLLIDIWRPRPRRSS